MMSLGDRLGTECPDKFADPIGYFEWFEDNKCPCCDGKGFRLYNVSNNDPRCERVLFEVRMQRK